MAIPDYQSIMLPLLNLAEDGKIRHLRDAVDILAQHFVLTDDEMRELLSSGQPRFYNRITWARSSLKKAGLLETPKRGYFHITEQGHQVLGRKPSKIDKKFLEQFQVGTTELEDEIPDVTPEEAIQKAYSVLRKNLADELLKTVMESSPEFFEHLVVDLLVRMGYGGSRQEAGEAIGRSGDEGIDGIINEDRLGLDIIYVQAKRWESIVGRPEVQKFAGALQGQRAHKGIFITTSDFSREAKDYVKNIEIKIILIGGVHLAELMIDHGVGVTTEATYELKRIDSDYFPYE